MPIVWGLVRELLMAASAGASQPAQQLRRSTEWEPLALRASRPANAEGLMAKGCRCRDKKYRFTEWVLRGCPLGVIRLRTKVTDTTEAFVALLRHDALFQLLSRARAHPLNSSSILRGYIGGESLHILRVAANLAGASSEDVPAGEHATGLCAAGG